VAGQTENDMILGTSSYKNGIRATTFRPETDAGLGILKNAHPSPKVVKTHYMNVAEQQSVVARARAARERAGTLPAAAADAPERDVLADVLAVMGADPGLHWSVLALRLSQRWPDRWSAVGGDAVSAQCRELGVPSVSVRFPTDSTGTLLKGCRRDSVAEAASRNIAGQPVQVLRP
jgi:S-DNA-T family DNA segregation ATPase FtsK/SpoIIIE